MKFINYLRECLIILLFSLLVITVSLGIFSRFLTTTPFAWTEEMSRFLFIWLAWVSASITVAKGANITFDILLSYLAKKFGQFPHVIADVISIIYIVLIIYFGYKLCMNNINVISPLLNIPMWLINLSIPIGGALMLIEQVRILIECRRGDSC